MSLKAAYKRKDTLFVSPTPGVEIEVSFFDPRNPTFIAEIQRITRPVRKMVENNLLTPAQDRAYAVTAFVATCVKGWRTVDETGAVVNATAIEEAPGVFLPYSQENAQRIFAEYPGLYSDTLDLARDTTSFRLTEDELGN